MKKNIYDTEYVNLSLEGEILVITYKKGPITLDIAKDLVEKRHAFSNGKSYLFLACDEGVGIGGIERDAREYMGKGKSTEGIIASAFYTKSAFNKHIINFFLRISSRSQKFPVKVFSDQNEARKWLESFDKNQ